MTARAGLPEFPARRRPVGTAQGAAGNLGKSRPDPVGASPRLNRVARGDAGWMQP